MAKTKYEESPEFKTGLRYAGKDPAPWPIEIEAKRRKAVERSEKSLEAYAKKQVEARGGLYLKFTSPGFTGVPDRLCIRPDGYMFFVEHKAPGGRLSARQIKVIRVDLGQRGVGVYVLSTKEGIDAMIKKEFDEV